MNIHSDSTKRPQDSKLEFYRVRLTAKICILLVCAVQCILRLIGIFQNLDRGHTARYIFRACTFFTAMIILITIEYIFYKRRSKILLKYSNIVDFVLLLLFIGDWVLSILNIFSKIPNPPCFRIAVIYGFSHFAWRTLLVTLIVQQWYLKVIPPIAAVIITAVFAIHYSTTGTNNLILLTIAQVLSLIIIIYCEDKVKWKMMWINLQQEKWIQVNNFILNNIPENIMILDFNGEARFISDYCKSFMQSCGFDKGNMTKDLLKKIKNLHQQLQKAEMSLLATPSSENRIVIQEEHLTTNNEFFPENTNLSRIESLEDLIMNFKKITGGGLHEKQFLVYNGKLKIDGEERERSIEIKISFIQHFKNEYIILILRDTTQRDLLVMLEETNKYKDQLLASVSHELRAPLNGTINMVESAVNSKKIPEVIKESLLFPALRSSKFLLHLINDILDMSQIKEKKLRLAFQSGDLKETIKSTAQLVELQAKKKGVELLLEIDPELPKQFCTDHIRLSQIILNVLNNAIKFTKEGTVKLIATGVENESGWVQISVEDSGIGMTEENVKKLFRNYTQIEFEGRQSMNPTGVGLGLNIAYNLAEMLAPEGHAKLSVTSAPNQGSTFTFIIENKEILHFEGSSLGYSDDIDELPGIIVLPKIQRSNTSKSNVPLVEKSSESSAEGGQCSCPQILIVDDNPFNTMAFETILNSLEIKCDSVYSGSGAIRKLLNRENDKCDKEVCRQYSVVFMDQEMPEMNGTEVTREIRRLQSEGKVSSSVRIIGCTAHQSKGEVDKFMKAGFDKCIHKPITPLIVKDILDEYL